MEVLRNTESGDKSAIECAHVEYREKHSVIPICLVKLQDKEALMSETFVDAKNDFEAIEKAKDSMVGTHSDIYDKNTCVQVTSLAQKDRVPRASDNRVGERYFVWWSTYTL